MNVTLIYFSQTGNTRLVAETMGEAFRLQGYFCRTISLLKATPLAAAECDLLGVGTPTFSSQAPAPVKSFLKTLPSLENRPAFVFATTGGAPGRVLYDLAWLLRQKGANVIGSLLTRGEVHYPAPCLRGRFRHRPDAQDLATARHFAYTVTEHVCSGRTGSLAGNNPTKTKLHQSFYHYVAFLSTDRFLRRTLPEPRLNPARCDRCRWCVYACPMHNISLESYPELGKQCIRCYRCLTGCPRNAFKANWGISNLAVRLLYNTSFERWFGDVKPGETIYSSPK